MRKSSVVVIVPLFFSIVMGGSPPDSETNPVTGNIETVDTATKGGNADNVRHTEDDGQTLTPTWVTDSSDVDEDPRISIKSNGDSATVWWRDASTDSIRFDFFDLSANEWHGELVLSDTSESSRHPSIVNDDSNWWVAFEYDDASGDFGIGVNDVGDDPDPIISPRVSLATTPFTGDLDVRAHYESTSLWVTWIDSSTDVGWCEYDDATDTWSSVSVESYSSDSVKHARGRIRDEVLAP